jgi:hypothetical protein
MLFVPRPGATELIERSPGVRLRLRVVAELIAIDARGRVRVLSGETQESIRVDDGGEDGPRVVVGGAAKFLEFGTSRQSPYPFLRPAADAVVPGGRRG